MGSGERKEENMFVKKKYIYQHIRICESTQTRGGFGINQDTIRN